MKGPTHLSVVHLGPQLFLSCEPLGFSDRPFRPPNPPSPPPLQKPPLARSPKHQALSCRTTSFDRDHDRDRLCVRPGKTSQLDRKKDNRLKPSKTPIGLHCASSKTPKNAPEPHPPPFPVWRGERCEPPPPLRRSDLDLGSTSERKCRQGACPARLPSRVRFRSHGLCSLDPSPPERTSQGEDGFRGIGRSGQRWGSQI